MRQTRKGLNFILLIYKMKTVNLSKKKFVNMSKNNFDDLQNKSRKLKFSS